LATSLLPFALSIFFFVRFFAVFYGEFSEMSAAGVEDPEIIMENAFVSAFPELAIYNIVMIALGVFALVVTWWYLGQKARSKWFLLLYFVPFGLIFLFLLENRAIGYGGDFVAELATDRWPDTGQFNASSDLQPKELEYRDVREVKDVSVGSETVPAEVPAVTLGETPVRAQPVERTSSQWTVKKPILLDNAGVVIKCFYHPDGDAVNSCSRCGKYVCSECDYVTGTHPICRNCWGKRSDGLGLAATASTQKSGGLGKPEKRKAEEGEWFREFMLLYERALPVIGIVIKKGEDGLPASPLDLMEGLKLRPMLAHVQNLSEPKQKELHEAKEEFEQVLSNCIRVAEAATEFVSSGGQAMPGQADYARVVGGIEMASGLMAQLSHRLASLSHS